MKRSDREAGDLPMNAQMPDEEPELVTGSSASDDADFQLIMDYLAGDLSSADRDRVEERLRTDANFRITAAPLILARSMFRAPGDREDAAELDPADAASFERSWEQLKRRIELEEQGVHTPTWEEKRAARRRRHRRSVFLTIFALAIGSWSGGAWLRPKVVPFPLIYAHVDASRDSDRVTRLPDSTRVRLARGSRLGYRRWLKRSSERTVDLDGKANFIAARQSRQPLTVDGAHVEVRAVEGQFTVQAYDAEPVAYVGVQRGSARVRTRMGSDYGKELTLHAGEAVQVGPGDRIERVDPMIGALVMSTDGITPAAQRLVSPNPLAAARFKFAMAIPALTDAIQRSIGQRPSDIKLTGLDTVDVRLWNPSFWWEDDSLKTLPEASLPVVRQAAKRTAEEVWQRYGRDGGINVIRVTFVRVRSDRVTDTYRELKDAQEVTAQFARQQLETGQLDGLQLRIVQL